jgi:hypothetical protein
VAISQSAMNIVVNVIIYELPLTCQPYIEPVQTLTFGLMNTTWCLVSSLALNHGVKVNKLVSKCVYIVLEANEVFLIVLVERT